MTFEFRHNSISYCRWYASYDHFSHFFVHPCKGVKRYFFFFEAIFDFLMTVIRVTKYSNLVVRHVFQVVRFREVRDQIHDALVSPCFVDIDNNGWYSPWFWISASSSHRGMIDVRVDIS